MSIVGVWRRYLQVKVLSLIVAILVVSFGVLWIWNIRTQAAAVLEQHKEASRSLADAIVQSIESSMLAGRPDIVRVMSQRLHTLKDVEQITIFRTNGVEAFTDLATLEEVQQGASLAPEVVDKIRSMQTLPTRSMHHPLFQQAVDMSLSRLNHGLPWGQAHPEVVQGTAEFHHQIPDTRLPQTQPVFDDPTPLHTAVDVLDP
jgi:hypothetical protein